MDHYIWIIHIRSIQVSNKHPMMGAFQWIHEGFEYAATDIANDEKAMIALKLKILPATVMSLNDFGFGFLQNEHFQSPLWLQVAGLSCMVGLSTSKVHYKRCGTWSTAINRLAKKGQQVKPLISGLFSLWWIFVFLLAVTS